MMTLLNFSIANIIFMFFVFSFIGWLFECVVLEGVFHHKLVNRGFLLGPYIPIYAAGVFAAYLVANHVREYPTLVFFCGALMCTSVEFISALLLEKIFNTRVWNYGLFPFGKWSVFQNRISLIPSLFFGVSTVGVIYFLWDFVIGMSARIDYNILLVIDALFSVAFVVDLIYTSRKFIKNKLSGIHTKIAGME
ncbi:MAG: putative ABC transporter permease [Treponema sp.]|jgi:uncharacterized membrane protein|nr:putative ABC transporter permease [Treponema sp.]